MYIRQLLKKTLCISLHLIVTKNSDVDCTIIPNYTGEKIKPLENFDVLPKLYAA